jgi:hypothetical protein
MPGVLLRARGIGRRQFVAELVAEDRLVVHSGLGLYDVGPAPRRSDPSSVDAPQPPAGLAVARLTPPGRLGQGRLPSRLRI